MTAKACWRRLIWEACATLVELKPNQNPRIKKWRILLESLGGNMFVLVRWRVSPVLCCKGVYVPTEQSFLLPVQSGRDHITNSSYVWSPQPCSAKGALCFWGRLYGIQFTGLLGGYHFILGCWPLHRVGHSDDRGALQLLPCKAVHCGCEERLPRLPMGPKVPFSSEQLVKRYGTGALYLLAQGELFAALRLGWPHHQIPGVSRDGYNAQYGAGSIAIRGETTWRLRGGLRGARPGKRFTAVTACLTAGCRSCRAGSAANPERALACFQPGARVGALKSSGSAAAALPDRSTTPQTKRRAALARPATAAPAPAPAPAPAALWRPRAGRGRPAASGQLSAPFRRGLRRGGPGHADREVLLLLGAHLPGSRRHVRA